MKFRTAAWTRGSLKGAPNTASDNSASPISSFFKLRNLTVGISNSVKVIQGLLLSFLHSFLNNDNASVCTRHRAANHQQVIFSIDPGDGQTFNGNAGISHMT